MKRMAKQKLVVAILALGMVGLAQADNDDNGKACSLSTLDSLYLFSASGFNIIGGVAQPKAVVELIRFNGDGTLTGGPATASINGTITRSPAGGLGNYTAATNCTGTLDFGPPTHFTYDFFIAPKAAYLVMIQTGGPVPGVLQGTADKLSR
jgi:hypothetical protein